MTTKNKQKAIVQRISHGSYRDFAVVMVGADNPKVGPDDPLDIVKEFEWWGDAQRAADRINEANREDS